MDIDPAAEDQCHNLLLRAMTPGDLALLQSALERVELSKEFVLARANESIEHVYFPEGGIASIVTTTPGDGRTEVGIFGRDGMSGIPVLLGSDRSTQEIFIQVDGAHAFRI